MDIIKNLSEEEITQLRDIFEESAEGLDVRSFELALSTACSKPTRSVNLAHLRLKELFSEIDVSGDGYVSWDEFIMYIINRTDGRNKVASATGLDGVIKSYQLGEVHDEDIPKTVVKMEYIPFMDKIVKVVRQERGGSSRVRILQNDLNLTPCFDIPRQGESQAVAFTFIPPGPRCHTDNTLAISYNDSYLRFFDMAKKRITMNNETRMVKSVRLSESQTCLKWSSRYNRLVMGSRTGIVSVIHPDEMQVYNQEKLHGLLISDMAIDDSLLFTASVDPVGSVKCIDLQRNVVRYELDDHQQGATMIAVNSSYQTLFSCGFELHVVSHAMLMPKVKPWKLLDTARPHRGRITQLQLVPNTPQLFSSDSCGLTKLWDIRMNSCVQNILPPKDELDITPPEQSAASSMCVIGPSKRVIINGRNTAIYCYEGAVDPSVADEVPAQIVLVNSSMQTVLSIHQSTIKMWDLQTGEITATHKDIVKNHQDISAALIVLPMERKLFIGTTAGNLLKLSCSMCDVEADLTPFIDAIPTCSGQELLSIQYIQTLRESSTSYVLVAFRKQIILVPDTEAHGTKSAIEVPALTHHMPSNVLIKCTELAKGGAFALIGCSDATVRVLDMNTLAVISSWSHSSVLRGDVVTLSALSLFGSSSGIVAFSAVGGGHVACGVTPVAGKWETADYWDGTEHCEVRMDAMGGSVMSDDVLPPNTPRLTHQTATNEDDAGAAQQQQQGTALSKRLMPLGQYSMEIPVGPLVRPSTTTESRASSGLSRTLPRIAMAAGGCRASSVVSPSVIGHGGDGSSGGDGHTDSAVATYLNATTTSQRQHLMSSCVVLVQILPHLDLLATADEKGSVSLWDVRPCLKHCSMYVTDPMAAPTSPGPPNLIRWWRAHEDEVTALRLMQDPEDQHTIFLLTASNDKKICLWSADGVLLGNLALGREEGAKVLPNGVHPYLFRHPRRKEYWMEFNAYMQRREQENTPLSVALLARSVPPPAAAARMAGASGRGSMPPRVPSNVAALQQHAAMNHTTSAPAVAGGGQGGWSGGSTPLPLILGPTLGEFSPMPLASSSPAAQTLLQVPAGHPLMPSTTGSNGDGASFFLTHTEVGASTLDPPTAMNSSTNALVRLQADRFGGIVKRSMLGTTPLKLDQVPRHLAHTGALSSSPRRVTTALPALSPRTPSAKSPRTAAAATTLHDSADRHLALSSRGGGVGVMNMNDEDTFDEGNLPSLPPSSPRRPPVSADPPQPHRPAVSQQSNRILRQCVRRYEPKTAEEFLRRNGRITLRYPGSPSRGGGSVNDGSVWGDTTDGPGSTLYDDAGTAASSSPTLTVTALSTLGSPSTTAGKGGRGGGLPLTPSSPVPRTAPAGYLPGNSLEVLETPSFRSLKAVLK